MFIHTRPLLRNGAAGCIFLCTLFLSSAIQPAAAQRAAGDGASESYHCLGLETGWLGQKEELLLPKVHRGFIIRAAYAYEVTGDRLKEFDFHIGYSRPATAQEDLATSWVLEVGTRYAQEFLLSRRERWSFHVGPFARVEYNFGVYPNWDDSHSYWGNYGALGGEASFHWEAGKGRKFMFSMGIPVVGLYSRPEPLRPYKIDDVTAQGLVKGFHNRLRGGTWDQLFALDLECAYQFPIGARDREAVIYSFSYLRISDPAGDPLQNMTHRLGVRFWL